MYPRLKCDRLWFQPNSRQARGLPGGVARCDGARIVLPPETREDPAPPRTLPIAATALALALGLALGLAWLDAREAHALMQLRHGAAAAALRGGLLRSAMLRWLAQGAAIALLLANSLLLGMLLRERHRHGRRLLEIAGFNSALFDTVGALLLVIDREGRIVRLNRAAQDFMGDEPEQLRRQPFHWARHLPPEQRDEVLSVFARLFDGQAIPRYDNPWLDSAGQQHLLEWRNTVLHDRSGRARYVITLGVDVTEARGAEARQRESELRELSERRRLELEIVRIGTAEQERIGREIHDGLGQQLTALGMLCASLQRRLAAQGQLQEIDTLQLIQRHLQAATSEARSMARGLSPMRIDGSSLGQALQALVDDVHRGTGVSCRFAMRGDSAGIDEEVATHLYRIAQEALNNALKHARAMQVAVQLDATPYRVRVLVRDDGVGLGASPRDNLGMPIMRHRAAVIGAMLRVDSSPAGTTVRCTWRRPQAPSR